MNPRLILAIDACERRLTVLHQVLVHLGHVVVLASTAAEAVSQSARHHPDAILLDLRVDGTDGRHTLRGLATDGWAATTPVIALADDAAAPRSGHPFSAVVRKPILLPDLAAALERCFRHEVELSADSAGMSMPLRPAGGLV
jgi:CheY-like chemotaxis protein